MLNGISDAEFEPIAHVPDPFDLVYVGELRPAKGIDTLIDAVALLRRERRLRLTLLIVGSGPDDGRSQARAKEAGIWDSVAFVPPQPIRHALARGAVMVIPSYAESLPYVILEAAAAAQPLVSTNVGGIPEIFGPHAGDLIPARDARGSRTLSWRSTPRARRSAAPRRSASANSCAAASRSSRWSTASSPDTRPPSRRAGSRPNLSRRRVKPPSNSHP